MLSEMPGIYYLLGLICHKRGRWAEARAYFEQYLKKPDAYFTGSVEDTQIKLEELKRYQESLK